MGWVQFKLGEYDSAIEFLTSAIERRNDPVMAAHLGEVLLGNRSKTKGKKNLESGEKRSPDSKNSH